MEIVIVGLGLIGGSIAKALKLNTPHRVLGMDISDDTLLDACSCGAIDGKATPSDLEKADLVPVHLPRGHPGLCPPLWESAQTRVHPHRRLRHQRGDLRCHGRTFPGGSLPVCGGASHGRQRAEWFCRQRSQYFRWGLLHPGAGEGLSGSGGHHGNPGPADGLWPGGQSHP